ncbi:DUF2845 domain-containing protein [Pseudomonas sp. CAN2814]|uniref:DUF2845 domain-containing protein n=1 Tax=Pseudomonas sp. CAN1 TaxID=3046726 RepID=UPI002647CD36|nr:DUF2845 domain-containing protein [Pseudomonas sp. CAN1]MDN6855990.1 DUF2845 domain-containing protein [Pseudomonas sp. CAN1]
MKTTLALRLAALLLPLSLASLDTQAASLRCNSKLISTGDVSSDVLSRCGDPVSRSFLGYKQVPGQRYGESMEVAVEEWIYGPWSGMLYFVRFEGNRLSDIQSKRSGN